MIHPLCGICKALHSYVLGVVLCSIPMLNNAMYVGTASAPPSPQFLILPLIISVLTAKHVNSIVAPWLTDQTQRKSPVLMCNIYFKQYLQGHVRASALLFIWVTQLILALGLLINMLSR